MNRDSQDKRQEHVGRNFHLAQRVDHRIALYGPVVEPITGDEVVVADDHGLPVPEPSVADRKNDSRDRESPDYKVDSNVPARVYGFSMSAGEEQKKTQWIVDEAEEDLHIKKKADISRVILAKIRYPFSCNATRSHCNRSTPARDPTRQERKRSSTGARGSPSTQSLPP